MTISRRLWVSVVVLLSLIEVRSVAAATITFDDVASNPEGPIADGYQGFAWPYASVDGYVHRSLYPGSGYDNGSYPETTRASACLASIWSVLMAARSTFSRCT